MFIVCSQLELNPPKNIAVSYEAADDILTATITWDSDVTINNEPLIENPDIKTLAYLWQDTDLLNQYNFSLSTKT